MLVDNVVLDLSLCPLMKKLESLENLKFKKHGKLYMCIRYSYYPLPLSLSLSLCLCLCPSLCLCLPSPPLASLLRFDVVKCDAETVEGHGVSNMFTNEAAGTGGDPSLLPSSLSLVYILLFFVVPFKTVKGKSVVNVIVKGRKENSWLHIVKIHMKVRECTSSFSHTRALSTLLPLLFSLLFSPPPPPTLRSQGVILVLGPVSCFRWNAKIPKTLRYLISTHNTTRSLLMTGTS